MSAPLFPHDAELAHASWGANCGPFALACALGLSCDQIRAAVSASTSTERFPELPGIEPALRFTGYMGVPDMLAAVDRAGARVGRRWSSPGRRVFNEPGRLLVFVQWGGSWMSNPRAAAAHRHWVAYQRLSCAGLVGDVNATCWLPEATWASVIVPSILPAGGDGTWTPAWACALDVADARS